MTIFNLLHIVHANSNIVAVKGLTKNPNLTQADLMGINTVATSSNVPLLKQTDGLLDHKNTSLLVPKPPDSKPPSPTRDPSGYHKFCPKLLGKHNCPKCPQTLLPPSSNMEPQKITETRVCNH